ncbi:hypothetical protein [Limosilactobacillus fermentum]|uniref:hypothetical protein n=1 Tax=Limosilactobacillus fermentum TaxID=1613 RepID=UPI000E472699|nr:hypothetical protein [Limosilactobacillus fermentum]MCD5423188.1 hypothetical protein [Limosilactobacillus fermentum]MPW02863.1 hypothetical protein [Limosilactobacillus fermentum]RGU53938.1 hypothetical protein DWW61_00555 [Limosilactobacillus fermentum]WRQ24431.1 hypothetical protein U5A78_10490 [Limosilactobacillus fermentum]
MKKALTNRLNYRNGMMRRKQRPIYTQSITVQTVNGLTAMIHRNKKVTELEEQVQSLKKQLASHELRIESAERKITELRMDYEKLITKGS